MIIDACGASHIGNIRKRNEDNLYVDGNYRKDLSKENFKIRSKVDLNEHIYAVFDGLGGEAAGEQASLIAAKGMKAFDEGGHAADVDTYVSTAHQDILKEAAYKDTLNMGTTAVALRLNDEAAFVFNVGDSRAYRFRDGRLEQLSKDHTVKQSMIDYGIDVSNDRSDMHDGELTQYIGMPSEDDVEPSAFTTKMDIAENDIFILCSDGLTTELSDDEIQKILNDYTDDTAEYLTARLIKQALDRAGRDNISVIVCKREGSEG